jgi:tRNA (guanine-N7-)-methyltransferase
LTESRHIRSYVLRQGRISSAQQRAHETLLPRYGIAYRESPIDLEQIFGRAAPKTLEIGFGMGETTAEIAAAQPQNDYLGVEVHTPGVGTLLKLIDARALTNVRIIQHECLDGVHIFFPDPWPKKKHHKRRLIQAPLIHLLAEKLKPGGILHAATDWHAYAEQILAVLSAEPALANTATDYAERPGYRPLTKFENRGLKLGHGVWDIVFRRR